VTSTSPTSLRERGVAGKGAGARRGARRRDGVADLVAGVRGRADVLLMPQLSGRFL